MPIWAEPYLTAANPGFYPLIFALILMAGLGAMISADFVILTVGYILFIGQADFAPALTAIIAGILLGDTLMFFIGGKFGLRLTHLWPFRKVLTPERIAQAEVSYRKYGYRIVFAARFMPGVRTVFMFTSGVLGLNYAKFILANALGAFIVVPLILLSVDAVAGNRTVILQFMQKIQWGVLAVAAALLMYAIYRRRKRTRALRASAETGSSPDVHLS